MAAAVLFLNSCDEETNPVDSAVPPVTVSGTLYAWRCGVGDHLNNPPRPNCRFYNFTGEFARVSFIRMNGPTYVTYTDENSEYELTLDKGFYTVEIFTRYTWPPDTFYNVEAADYHDNIDFDIVYRTLDPNYLAVVFTYSNREDTNMAFTEWQYVRRLNQFLGGILVTPPVRTPEVVQNVYQFQYFNYVRVYYLVPIRYEMIHWGEVWPRAEEIFSAYGSEFPLSMNIDPWGS